MEGLFFHKSAIFFSRQNILKARVAFPPHRKFPFPEISRSSKEELLLIPLSAENVRPWNPPAESGMNCCTGSHTRFHDSTEPSVLFSGDADAPPDAVHRHLCI